MVIGKAARYVALPGCDAVTLHVPAVRAVSVLPLTVQTEVELDA